MSISISLLILLNRSRDKSVILYNCIARQSNRSQLAATDRPLYDGDDAILCNTSRSPAAAITYHCPLRQIAFCVPEPQYLCSLEFLPLQIVCWISCIYNCNSDLSVPVKINKYKHLNLMHKKYRKKYRNFHK